MTQRRVQSQTLHTGHVFTIRQDLVELPDGRRVSRDIVAHPGAVVIVPRLADGRLVLVRQWRYAAGEALWEFPAGTLEADEPPAACAERELQEEAGYRPGRLVPLGQFFSAPGFCTELLHVFLAEELVPSRLAPDADEEFETAAVAQSELLGWVAGGQVRDAKTLAGLMLLLAWRQEAVG